MYDSGLCFVCAHLASGENEGDELKRNYDYSEIVRRGQFPPDSASLDPDTAFSGASETASQVRIVFAVGVQPHLHGNHTLCHMQVHFDCMIQEMEEIRI